ncbi:MAG: hypothetical protein WC979_02365 [Candidatus Pacearchaeota archaeon]|jgi:hypothetical protein|nr:hypothetical protein [Clostridia bacterium]
MNKLVNLVNKYPNDAALGEMLRRYVLVENGDCTDAHVVESVDKEFKILGKNNSNTKSAILTNYFLAKSDYERMINGELPNDIMHIDLLSQLEYDHLEIDTDIFNEVFSEYEEFKNATPFMIVLIKSAFPSTYSIGNVYSYDFDNLICFGKTVKTEEYESYLKLLKEKYVLPKN